MRKLRHRLRERPDEEDQRRDPRIAGQRSAVRVERGDVDLVMMGDVGNLRPALRQAARDDPLEIARRHRFDGTAGGELGRPEEHTPDLQYIMHNWYADYCLKQHKK